MQGSQAPMMGQPQTFVAFTKGNDTDEVVIRTLVGEYVEQGSNHGRKVFKKTPDGVSTVDVYMYYWDGRDGPAFQGWWFGNQLGGTQVWSHNANESLSPPTAGWKIPWDGQVRTTLYVLAKADHQKHELQEKLRNITNDVNAAVTSAKETMAQARTTAGDFQNVENVSSAEAMVTPHTQSLTDVLNRLIEVQRGATGEPARQMVQLGAQVRAAQQNLSVAVKELGEAKARAEQVARQRAKDDKCNSIFMEFMPLATEKTHLAEDSVEKAVITAEMIAAGGEDADSARQAVAETEQAVTNGLRFITDARLFLQAKQATVRRFESESVRGQAIAEIQKLLGLLADTQKKLNPLRTARQDHLQRVSAQQLIDEILEHLTPAEVDVDRAEESCVVLTADEDVTKEQLQQAEQAVSRAIDNIDSAMRFVDYKKRSAQHFAREQLEKVDERCRVSLQRISDFRAKCKEAAELVSCGEVLKEAGDKLQAVSEAVSKAADAEGPFLMGVEELPIDETLAAVKACEAASTSANTAVSIARMFLATKLVEAKRFSKGPSEHAQGKIKQYQGQLDTLAKRLADLKNSTMTRKKKALEAEAEGEVTKAEDLAKRVMEAAKVFMDESSLCDLSAAELRAAADETLKAEAAANAALMDARKFITARQIEAKGKDTPNENVQTLVKYQARLTTAQSEVGKCKKLSSSVDQRLAAKKAVEEAESRLKSAEERVKSAVALAEAVGEPSAEAEGDPVDEKKQAAERAAADANSLVKAAGRLIEQQARSADMARGEFAKLQPRVAEAQSRLDEAMVGMRERSEKLQANVILEESEKRVSAAEDAVQAVVAVEVPEELQDAEAKKALVELEASVATAQASVGGAKTFLAMRRLAAKRLGEAAREPATNALTELQTRLDKAAKTLAEAKKGLAEKRAAAIRQEVAKVVEEAEEKVKASVEATEHLVSAVQTSPDAMKKACERAGTAQSEAQSALEAARAKLLARQRDAKNASSGDAIAGIAAAISSFLEKVVKMTATVESQKGQVTEQEHKFVADRLLKEATDIVDKLEKKLEAATKTAAPLASDNLEGHTAVIFLTHILDMLKAHLRSSEKTALELFTEMGGKTDAVTEAQFVAFVTKLLAQSENKDAFFSEEQQIAAFKQMLKDGSSELSEADFAEQFRSRFLVTTLVAMTDSLTVKGGKTVRKLEADEVVEALEEPKKESNLGVLRVRARAEKDAKEGFITLSGNQGTVYLEPYSGLVATKKQIDRVLQDLGETAREAGKYVEQKAEELRAVRSGPLADTRNELQKFRPRIKKVEQVRNELKIKVASTEKKLGETMEVERRKRKEAEEKAAAAAMLEEITTAMAACQAKAEKSGAAAEALAKSNGSTEDDPLQAIDKAVADLRESIASTEAAATLIKDKLEGIKGSVKGPLGDLRAAMVKMKVNIGAMEGKCKKQLATLASARKQVSNDAHTAVVTALRSHAKEAGLSADAFFKEVSQDGSDIPAERLRDFLLKLPDASIKESQLDLGLERYALGLARLSFMEMVQDYMKCVKDIALTTSLEVKTSKTVRKLALGEVVEVLGIEKTEDRSGLARARCRALLDGVEGYVTIKGNQGTDYLEKTNKSYYRCDEALALHSTFEASGPEVRRIKVGEVFEALEGPRREAALQTERIKGKAKKDGNTGWVTLKDASGVCFFEPSKQLVCKQGIAITTAFDISEGKPIRKLEVGEPIEPLGEEQTDEKRGLVRIKAKTAVTEGWVTIKGNQGTSYATPDDKLYVCKQSTPLEAQVKSGGAAVRTVEAGELFEVLDGPKTESRLGAYRVQGRSLVDSSEGWFSVTTKSTPVWSPLHRCVVATALQDSVEMASAKDLRTLEVGERLQALAPPTTEATDGVARLRVRAEKDGIVGFATLRDGQSTVLLEPVTGRSPPPPPPPPVH